MKHLIRPFWWPVLVAGLLPFTSAAAPVFDFGDGWKYLIVPQSATTPTAEWVLPAYNDDAWPSGPTPIGYGEPDIATSLRESDEDPSALYSIILLRKDFVLGDPADLSQLQLRIRADDGAVVWINGAEVGRFNVPAGSPGEPLPYNTFASSAPTQWTENEVTLTSTSTPSLGSVVQEGNNVVAVQLVNGTLTSSDIYLDGALDVIIVDPVPPTLVSQTPAPGTLNELTQITLTFSEPVTGVDPSDLLLNGQSASSFSGAGDTYTFFFPQPAFGTVTVGFNPGHGITDFALPANPFDHTAPEASWQYELVDVFPPVLASVFPTPDTTVRDLAEIQIRFDEPVTGVNASDLLINGSPADAVAALSDTQYTFSFAEPPPGTVTVAWAAGHGIQDLADVPNDFAGGQWTYELDPNAVASLLFITEFMAANDDVLLDEDGDAEDWIEIHNAGDIDADMRGWHLTDDPDELDKWKFPSVTLPAGGFMVVFASNKDRRDPEFPLHTNFRLSAGGEYLALVRPDGATIASEYSPEFPAQVADVSYGLPTASAPTFLVEEGDPALYFVPPDGTLGLDWTFLDFNDSAWNQATNGIGFEGSPATSPNLLGAFNTDVEVPMRNFNSSVFMRIPFVVQDAGQFDFLTLRMKYDDGFIAYLNGAEMTRRNAFVKLSNSAEDFSGVQGQDNWEHGYYNRSLDADGSYSRFDFISFNGGEGEGAWDGFNQQWTGTAWDLETAARAPWTTVGPMEVHPNGTNNGEEHWAIRRYQVDVTGTLTVRFFFAKANINSGNGVTGRVFHNGTQIFERTIAFNDNSSTTNLIRVQGVSPGDLLDFAIDPTGTDGVANDGSDGTTMVVDITHDEGLFADWNIAASATHSDADAVVFEEDNVSGSLPGLASGTNVLAIHGLNSAVSDDDFLSAVELVGRSATVLTDQPRYFTMPTPGAPNGLGTGNLGPVLSDLDRDPITPIEDENITVSIRVQPTFNAVTGVTLHYRVMYGNESTLAMVDTGLAGDAVAGDGVYTAVIPASAASAGQLVRWYVTAADAGGNTSRFPLFEDPLNSPEYDGTVVHVPPPHNLSLMHLFAQNFGAAATDTGTRCSIYYLDQLYDNLNINIHGQSSRGFTKKSYDIDFHPGHNFRWKEGEDRVDDINMMTPYPDKAYMRNILAYETYRIADAPYHWVFPVRIHLNGAYLGLWHIMENGDDNWLERLGHDKEDALYKMYATFTSFGHTTISVNANAEKKSRKFEGNDDLVDLYNGMVTGTTQSKTNYMFDNMDIPGTVNYLAARVMTQDRDCCHKNYYFFRDTTGNGEWTGFPWDVDLSFGRNWNSTDFYWDNNLQFNNGLFVGNNNGVFREFFNIPHTRQMYLRRIRTLMDELLQSPNTPPAELVYENMIDDLAQQLRPDAAEDLRENGTWIQSSGGPIFNTSHPDYETLDEAIGRMKQVLVDRRDFMFSQSGAMAEIPDAQPSQTTVNFGTIEFNPGTGDQAHEYLELVNPNDFAVDISGWRLTGGIQHTFKGGVVIPANGTLYVSPDVNGFRSRPISPRAGEGRFVQGDYSGQLTARGETINLVHRDGRLMETRTYQGDPSLPQQYLRITEVMYHPARAGDESLFRTEDFEYIELKNIGAEAISLAGVRFTNGIVFDFTTSAVTSLQPGERVLVVKSIAAYTSRHGNSVLIAGEYGGQLDNGGERIRLDDADGEKILDFEYRDGWYPITDGLGFSLVIIDETADFRTWDLKESWRASGTFNGSPGAQDPDPVVSAPVLVNEALTHTDALGGDVVELYNPSNAPVDVSGWFLSDDFFRPTKFRIPDGSVIAAGGFLLFDATQFNPTPGVGDSFALSELGEEIYLFAGNGAEITGYFHGFEFGASENGVTFGRHVISTGDEHFVSQVQTSLGNPNVGPLVGPVVIGEVHYHPVDLAGGEDNADHEFIELVNITGQPVPLYDPDHPANTWVLLDAVEFVFPEGLTLDPGQHLLVVNFNPTSELGKLLAFRERFNVPTGTRVLGPYGGKLDNSGESVELYKPGAPEPDLVPLVLVDKVRYRDEAPWPAAADGFGPSLVREVNADYGNDPANWRAAAPTPGRASLSDGLAPVITAQPEDRFGVLGQETSFSVSATGTAPLQYQWLSEEGPPPNGTFSTLLLEDLELSSAGLYRVAVFNEIGATISSNAMLQVLIPAVIIAQPESQAVLLSSNVTFSVSALSPSSLSYQWLKDGNPIAGATNESFSINLVQESDAGGYSVLITDPVATIESDVATLTVLIEPEVILMPTSYTVVEGGSVVLSLESTGTLPMSYRWRQGFRTLKIETLDSHKSFLHLSNVSTNDGGPSVRYTCVLTNAAFFTPGRLSPSAFLTVLPDADGDGLPDAWEEEHELDDPSGDKDGDGVSNGDEYIAGTDPGDDQSFLKVEEVTLGPGVNVVFNAAAEKTYTVEYTDGLDMPVWQKLDDVPAGPARSVTVIDLDGEPGRFYRLVTPRQQ